MIATLRRLLLVSAAALALPAAGLTQVSADLSKTWLEAGDANARADYVEAARLSRIVADQGFAPAQRVMGMLYRDGRGVPQNDVEAVRWLRLAADQGDSAAQYDLGAMYANGQGVGQDWAEAARWWRLASDLGEAEAQFDLGIIYTNGQGVPQDDAEAVRWYRLAADQGHAQAQFSLGLMYAKGLHGKGRGVPQNDVEAVRWYHLAADQGDARAQYNLGLMYAKGRGLPQNDIDAYKWFSLAAAQGNSDAAQNRDFVRRQMTAAQIAEGQRLASAWKVRSGAEATEPHTARNEPTVANQVESTGSGFFISAAGHLLTNAHVVDDCTRVSLAGGASLTVLDIDLGSDLALLKAGASSARTTLRLRQGRGIRLGDSIVVAGYPLTGLLSSGLNVTTGAVSALAGPGDDRRLIQITAPVQPGNSGGPLLDSSGNVVGVVVSKLDAVKVASVTGDIPQNVNFAIALGTLQAFLDSNDVDYQTRASTTTRSNADVAEVARVATVQIECRN